jgi:hypothetical protein
MRFWFIVACGVVALLPAGVQARCVTADDLVTGVTFKRENGRSGLVTREGKEIVIDYSTMSDDWTDRRTTLFGVYELSGNFHYNELPTVGGGYPFYEWKFASRPTEPRPGKSWRAEVTERREEDIGTERMPPPDISQRTQRYVAEALREVTLSGCTYSAFTVNLTIGSGKSAGTRRYIYFPDLGFGLETRVGNTRIGLTAMEAK